MVAAVVARSIAIKRERKDKRPFFQSKRYYTEVHKNIDLLTVHNFSVYLPFFTHMKHRARTHTHYPFTFLYATVIIVITNTVTTP